MIQEKRTPLAKSAATPALRVLTEEGIPYSLHEYEVEHRSPGTLPPNFGELVAQTVGVNPQAMYKTLVATVDGTPHFALVPVAKKLDLKALAKAVGGKRAQMARPNEAQRLTGYVQGGISPLGSRTRLSTVIDSSVEDWDSIYISAGRRGLTVALAPDDLKRVSNALYGPISG